MANRKISFVTGEYYHVYNRGVDKRDVISDSYDANRFMQSILEFNSVEPIGSIYENSFNNLSADNQLGSRTSKLKPLVNFICYCLNPNHYHFILEQVSEQGVEKFMQRLGTGYTKYFNNRYKRSGSLFQGKFKATHINSNEYLLHLSVYVNLNDRTHTLGSPASKCVQSSWGEYVGETKHTICNKDIIFNQFKNQSEYKDFALNSLEYFQEKRRTDKELSFMLLD